MRMFLHGYTDEDIVNRLRYDLNVVKALREKFQNNKSILKVVNEQSNV